MQSIPQIQVSCCEYDEISVYSKQNSNFLASKTDRFIPNRTFNDMEQSHHLMTEKTQSPSKVLNFSPQTKHDLKVKYFNTTPYKVTKKRKVSTRSFLVLDAPNVKSDFYFNLLDWSDSNHLVVGLGKDVYIWNQDTKESRKFISLSKYNENSLDISNNYVTSLKWINNETLAIGSDGLIEIWDINHEKCVNRIFDHLDKVSCMGTNGNILTSGSYASPKVFNHDFRKSKKISEFSSPDFICGLNWNLNGRFLALSSFSGSLYLWDIVSGFDKAGIYGILNGHESSVKALSWCPWQSSLLASGGGKADGKVKFWNVYNSTVLKEIDAECQVTGLVWSNKKREILFSRNYESFCDLVINDYPKLDLVAELEGHVDRIISVSISKDEMVASLGSDETVRFWDCFKDNKEQRDFSSPISTKNFNRFQNLR